MKDLQDTTVAIRIPVYLKKIAHKLADRENVSMSKYIRHLIQFEYQRTFESSKHYPEGVSNLFPIKEGESERQLKDTNEQETDTN